MENIKPEKDFTPLKKCCERYGWVFDSSLEFAKSVNHVKKENMNLYNYGDGVFIPRNHPLLIKCRGLVVDNDGKILNYPFDRFFNYWEKEFDSSKMDWSSSEIQEKLDGSLVCVFWNGSKWEIITRGSFYGTLKDNNKSAFDEWFKEVAPKDLFEKMSIMNCYVFELISKHNPIVTDYQEEGVYLIGIRSFFDNMKEYNQIDLDYFAKFLGVKRPRKFGLSNGNIDELKNILSKEKNDFEGFVVVDKDCNRVKVKSETYLRLARIKQLSDSDILDYVLGKTQIEQEFLDKLPEVQNKIADIKEKYLRYKEGVTVIFEEIKPKALISRKEFALKALKYPFKGHLFALLDGKPIEETLKIQDLDVI